MLLAGTDDLWRNVAATPADKLDWKPEEKGRSIRELLEELVSATNYGAAVLATKSPAMDAYVAHPGLEAAELESLHRAAVKGFISAMKSFPQAELDDKVELPWGAQPYFDSVSYTYWNLMYHNGQIGYIQTLYGDKETH